MITIDCWKGKEKSPSLSVTSLTLKCSSLQRKGLGKWGKRAVEHWTSCQWWCLPIWRACWLKCCTLGRDWTSSSSWGRRFALRRHSWCHRGRAWSHRRPHTYAPIPCELHRELSEFSRILYRDHSMSIPRGAQCHSCRHHLHTRCRFLSADRYLLVVALTRQKDKESPNRRNWRDMHSRKL